MNPFQLAEGQEGYRQVQSSNGETKWIIHVNRKFNAASPKIWPSGHRIAMDLPQSL